MKLNSIVLIILTLAFVNCKGGKETNSNQITNETITDSVVSAVESYGESISLEGTKWKLVQIKGKNVEQTSNKELAIFFEENKRFSAFMGCNGIGGNYELQKGNRILFSKVISTQMACVNMEIESEFNSIVEKVDNYSITNNKLTLNKARMAPLAVFEKM